MSTLKTFTFGAAVGAAAMYLMDPHKGLERRAQVQEAVDQVKARDDVQKVAGSMIDLTRPLHDRGPGSDPALADKVRSEVMGRDEFSDLSLNIDAADGVVTLRGVIEDEDTRRDLVEAVSRVGGVTQVEDLMHQPDASTSTTG